MTGLADSIRNATRPSGKPCSVAVLRSQLDGDVLNDFDLSLHDSDTSARAVHEGLVAYFAGSGETVTIPGAQTIAIHRRRECRCEGKR